MKSLKSGDEDKETGDGSKVNEKLRMPRIPFIKENQGLPYATGWLDWLTRKFPPWGGMIQDDFDEFVLKNMTRHRMAPLAIQCGKGIAHYRTANRVLGYELSPSLGLTLSPYVSGIDARD